MEGVREFVQNVVVYIFLLVFERMLVISSRGATMPLAMHVMSTTIRLVDMRKRGFVHRNFAISFEFIETFFHYDHYLL